MGAAGSIISDDARSDIIGTPSEKRRPGNPNGCTNTQPNDSSAGGGSVSSSNAVVKSTIRPNKDNVSCPTFQVGLGFWPGKKIELPERFKLRVSYESLDFVREDESPLIQFPYQNIICWGSSRQNFQFKVFDFESPDDDKNNGILISLKTTQGRLIEDATMATVQKLIVDINHRAISKEEFSALQNTLFDENGNLIDGWISIIDQFTAGQRLFLAKQGMELLIRIGNLAPFEKFDLACLLYDRIINKDSFQLLVNTFPDEQERDNLIHRLKLDKNLVKNCVILPEKSGKS